jgi:genome maintenance exonuclease 1
VVGIYDGRESIIDFKQSNKFKKREWIDDYFIQTAAYAMAHNYVYGTAIQSGVILISVKGGEVLRYVSSGTEFKDFTYKWLERVGKYGRTMHQAPGPIEANLPK